MNEQQLQQLITIQQALAAAATAAVINSLLNPQQAAGLVSANALTDPTNNDLQPQENRQSPATTSPATTAESNSRIQDLLMQLHQQASVGSSPVALNLNLGANQQQAAAANQLLAGSLGSPLSNSRSPISSRLSAAQELNSSHTSLATSSNTQLQQSNQVSPLKKLKSRHHHQNQAQIHATQQYQHANRSSEATSKPQHSTPKNHSNISNLSRNSNTSANNTTSSSTSSPFISSNNVGLPRKLVRGQDVWLGRGAEQTRQILKCMWCGQSFRTLAEMTQHMKITQHYTNIISQEQITSWRQPESSETTTSSNLKHNKQSSAIAQVRNLVDDNHDDLSDKFNDSDRDDNFSNDDDLESRESPSKPSNRLEISHHHQNNPKNESDDNHSTTESNHDDSSPKAFKGSPNGSKPLTRSKRRENDTLQSTKRRNGAGRANSPATSSYSQQQRQNSSGGGSNLILGDLNDGNSEMIGSRQEKKCKTNGKTSRENLDAVLNSSRKRKSSEKDDDDEAHQENGADAADDGNENDVKSSENDDKDQQLDSDEEKSSSSVKNETVDEEDDKLKRDGESRTIFGGLPAGKDRRLKEKMKNVDDNDEDHDDQIQDGDADDGPDGDNDDDEQRSETNESVTINTTTSGSNNAKKGDTGDPLSALETMVEKSFDPRMRPGVATGGILQRLGIDEEVCPPWQHINYQNWYAAAAFGHPMAAALLAAGINFQNGIKLSKNVDPKKSDDCG